MKKFSITSILLPLLFITSCANSTVSTSVIDNNLDDKGFIKEDVTINFLCMADKDFHSELQSMINEFEKNEPHVKVNLYNPLGSGSYAMIEKLVVAGFFKEDYPDLVQCYPDNVVKYIAQGYAVNVDEYLNNKEYGLLGEEKEDYITAFLEEGTKYTVDGTYSLPFCKSSELLYYNADALIGLDLSSQDSSINNGLPLDETYLNDLTWEELFDKLCPAIETYNDSLPEENKLLDDSPNTAIFTYDSDENFFITAAEQYGYGYTSISENGKGSIDFNNEGMKNIVKKLKIAKDKKYLQTRGTYHDYVSYLFQERHALFTVSSTAGLSYNFNFQKPFNMGVAKLPHAQGHEYSSINQGPSVCILNHNNNARSLASFLLWKHMTNKENSSSWALKTGYMGIRNSSYINDDYKNAIKEGENAKKIDISKLEDVSEIANTLYSISKSENLKKIAEIRESTYNTSVFRGSSNARTNVGKLLKDCLLSTDLDAEIDELFNEYAKDAESYLLK